MEKWDVYDKDRNKIKLTVSSKKNLNKDQYRLVAHLCIFNSKNQLLIQKRSPNKTLYPNLWDLTVSGSVLANETSREAMERELFEELGITLSLKEVRVSMAFNFDEGFDDIFITNADIDLSSIKMEAEEVIDVSWASQNEIFDMIKIGTFIPYHKSVIELLFFNKDKMRIHTI